MKNRILVVEDERIISDLICMNLEAAGYETRAVYDGNETAGLLREHRYHVPGCMYVKDTEKKKWRTTSMQKEEAERRGYTPCRICGGAAVV